MKARHIFVALTESNPVALITLPTTFGIYALWDHERRIRYIGCTPKATEGFHVRVANKHVTGSEGRSHKFSHAYCVGRMWRYSPKLHPSAAGTEQEANDANLAKKLRSIFIRRHCGVTFVEVPHKDIKTSYFSYLTALEAGLQAGAPDSMREWEGVRFTPSRDEPTELVDIILKEHPHLRSAAERQNALYLKYVHRNAAA